MSAGKSDPKRDVLVLPVAAVVLLAWVAALCAALITREYAPLTAVTPVMLLLAGYVFGSSIVKSAREQRDD
jgi:hypothetical protein